MHWQTRVGKRSFDVAISATGLLVTAPLFALVALAVRLTSPGRVFYAQVRCGAERRAAAESQPAGGERRHAAGFHTFRMVKFRTMRADAERTSGAVLAQTNDPRLTPIGGFLRKTRLDELPQLWHVLVGDMSLIGPRPERPELMAQIEAQVPFFRERMRLIKPGLTGLAQIKLGYDGSFREGDAESQAIAQFLDGAGQRDDDPSLQTFANKLLYDLSYSAVLERPSAWLRTDLEIMVKTPLVMLMGAGR